MLGGAITDSPYWLPWAVYWCVWAAGHAVWWVIVTATMNCEALIRLGGLVFWALMLGLVNLAAWGWKQSKSVFGVREAVDFGQSSSRLGKVPRQVLQGQTKLRVWGATYALLVGAGGAAGLLALATAGAWSIPLLAGVFINRYVRNRRRTRWFTSAA